MSKYYESPFKNRYSSKEMLEIFSQDYKFSTWRKLWIALAEAEKELGLDITQEQIDEMKKNIINIDYETAEKYEKKFKHDVMAHIHTFGEVCPNAMPIIHLGATSAYVGDNTDIIQMRSALELVRKKAVNLIYNLKEFAVKYKDLPTLGYTHLQPAQLTTVGKRATLWIMDLILDIDQLEFVFEQLKLRGVKGTTGTQASFLNLFDGDHEKIKKLDKLIAEKFNFKACLPVTGQTYTRKIDSIVLNSLGSIAQSMHKITNDIRLLQSVKEIEEPFGKNQIGSSAMAYKRNPMKSERIASLSRFVISNTMNPQLTQSAQWFERTLDDSANKRLVIPESFLAIDAILDLAIDITSKFVVYPKIIEKRVALELPFMATENIIMQAVKNGGNRQELHELIRIHSMEAGRQVKELGLENDLLERIVNDKAFNLNNEDINKLLISKNYIGRSIEQVEEFIKDYVNIVLEKYKDDIGIEIELKV